MRKFVAAGLIVMFGWVVVSLAVQAQDKPKYSIKDVMQKAHKGGLMKKVADGKATPEEKKQLLEFYEALAANKPPVGDEADWKVKTSAIVAAARAAAEGDEKAAEKLQASAGKCADCHKAHKGK
jgi:surface antigen